jgi:hypothetical protein
MTGRAENAIIVFFAAWMRFVISHHEKFLK